MKYLWYTKILKIKTINKKYLRIINVCVINYDDQNANKKWSFEVFFWRAKNYIFEVIKFFLEMFLESIFMTKVCFSEGISLTIMIYRIKQPRWIFMMVKSLQNTSHVRERVFTKRD